MKILLILTLLSIFSCGKHTLNKGDNGGGLTSTNAFNSNQLITATVQGNYTDVKRLLSEGADPNTVDENGQSLLMIAAKSNNFIIVDLLMKSGADTEYVNEEGETALDRASNDFTKKLIAENDAVLDSDWEGYLMQIARESSQDKQDETINEMQLLFNYGLSPNTADRRGTILIYACNKVLYDIVAFLLTQEELDINLIMGSGRRSYTALDRTRDQDIKDLLVANGAKSAKELQ